MLGDVGNNDLGLGKTATGSVMARTTYPRYPARRKWSPIHGKSRIFQGTRSDPEVRSQPDVFMGWTVESPGAGEVGSGQLEVQHHMC